MRTLDSGLRALVLAVPGAPVTAVQVWIGSGGADELADEEGLAHLHEHMLFKGTPTRGVGEVAAAVERVGGDINAWTSNDHTCYHAVVPSRSWFTAVEVLADAVSRPLFDAAELAREIEVVVEEIRRAADNPMHVVYERVFAELFAGHPYARPVLGTVESVRSMTPDRMRDFWRKHYVAPNTTVVVAGDVDADAVHAAIAAAFVDQPKGPPPTRSTGHLSVTEPRGAVLDVKFSESRFVVAWPVPGLEHPDGAALDVLALALGQGDSSRLVRIVQRDQQLANEIGSSTWTPPRTGLFAITALTSRDRLDAARAAALDVVQAVRKDGIADADLAKARANLLADATYKLETAQGQANALGYFAAATGDPHWDRVYDDRVRAVTAADVLRVARQYLGPDRVCVVELAGTEDVSGHGDPSPLRTDGLLADTAARLRLHPADLALRTPDVLDGIERILLPSGDVLVARPDRSVPVWSLRVAVLGGLRDEDATTNGRAHLQAQLLTRGSGRRSAHDVAREVEALAAGLAGSAGRNSLSLQAVGMSSARAAVLDLFCDALHEAMLPEADLEQERSVQLEDLRHEADQPARVALRTLTAELYGSHPYGMDMLGSEASVRSLKQADLLDHLRGRLAPGQLVYGAAGDIDPHELARALSDRTPHGRSGLAAPRPPAPPALAGPVQLRRVADKQQAHVALGFRAARLNEADRFALDVLATVLGGQAGRLFLELRDRQSLAYSVSAFHAPGLDTGNFVFYIGTSPDKVQQATAGLRAELDRVLQAPPAPEELARAKASLAGNHATALQRRSARAATLCLNELYGLGRSAWKGHLERLDAVLADDVLDVARRYLDTQRCVEVVLAPNA
ncbi:MAG: insulinase family protein [Myxococcales bacterium]|nr:insulinase family protein [Myxococcales bacterium]